MGSALFLTSNLALSAGDIGIASAKYAVMIGYANKVHVNWALLCRFILLAAALLCLAACPSSAKAQSVTLAWNASPSANVAGYMVYYGTDGVTFKGQMDAGANTYATVNNLQAGNTYYFEVTAYDPNLNQGNPSAIVTFSIPGSGEAGTNGGGGLGFDGVPVGSNGVPEIPTRTVVTNATNGFTVLVGGNGTVAPTRLAKTYVTGKKFVLTAVPGRGSVFDGWLSNGVAVVSGRRLSFVVEPNLVLQANFITNPFVPVVGVYHGLFYVPSNAVEESSGAIAAVVTSAGAYNARLFVGARPYSISGSFSVDGLATNTIRRPGTNSITVQLQFVSTNSPLTGSVSDGAWTADLLADPAVYTRTNPAPEAGKYTMVMPGGTNAGQPAGNGFGSVVVNPLGDVTFSGFLGDGTPLTAASVLSSEGQWPFYAPLYGGGGSILGWLAFTNGSITGQLGWFKAAAPKARLYSAGFTNTPDVVGSTYKYTNDAPALGFTTADLVVSGGDFGAGATNTIVLNDHTQATNFVFNPASGMFHTRVMDPETSKPVMVSGIVVQNEVSGAGFFMTTNGTGSALLLQAP